MKTTKYKVSLAATLLLGGIFIILGCLGGSVGVARAQTAGTPCNVGLWNQGTYGSYGNCVPNSTGSTPTGTVGYIIGCSITDTDSCGYNSKIPIYSSDQNTIYTPNPNQWLSYEPYDIELLTTSTVTLSCNGDSQQIFSDPGISVFGPCPIGSSIIINVSQSSTATAPSNLTAATTSVATQINLKWQNNASGQTGVLIERASSGSSFSQIIQLMDASSVLYSDANVKAGTSYQYRIRGTLSDGSYTDYSNVASISTTICALGSDTASAQQLKAVYDKLPNQLTGSISPAWYISALINVGGLANLVGVDSPSDSIKKVISALALPGQSLQNGILSGMRLLLDPGPIVHVSDSLSMDQISISKRLKAVRFIKEAVLEIGTKYGLNSNEINELFAGMTSNEAPLTINSFSFNGAFAYSMTKNPPVALCAVPGTSNAINDFFSGLSTYITTPPVVSSIVPVTGATANTFTISGSGFDTTGNMVKLTPVSGISLAPSPVLEASAYPAFNVIWNFLRNLIPKAHGQTTSSNGFYGIDDISSNGSSLTFSVPTTTPNGTYKVSVAGFNSPWTDTPYTITVSGNGTGDPTTEVGDIAVDIGTVTPPPTVITTSTPAIPAYTCPSSYTLTSSNTCVISGTSTSKLVTIAGYSCPDNHYTLSGTSCTINAVSSATVQPASTVYTCSSGYAITPSNTCTINTGTVVLAKVVGYSCFDPHYTVSGKACNINAIPAATVQSAVANYKCPSGYVLTPSNSCTLSNTGTFKLATISSYTCPTGYALSGTACSIVPNSPASALIPSLTATPVSGTSINLSWTDNDAGITGYTVSEIAGSATVAIKTLTGSKTTSYTVTYLSPSTNYCFMVHASFGSFSSKDSPMTCASTPPDNTISVSITKISTGSGTVTGNGIKCGAGGTVCSANLKSTTDLSLKASPASGSAFYGWGFYGYGYGSPCQGYGNNTVCSQTVSNLNAYYYPNTLQLGTTATFGPSAPKSLKASASVQGQISLSWNNNGVTNISGISVERSTAKSSGYAQIGIATSTSYIDTGLPSSTAYYYQIRMLFNSGTYGPYTDAVKATVDKPSTPSLKATATTSSVVGLSWSDSDAGVISYNVQETSPTPISIATVPYPTKSYVVTGLQPSTKYCFTVSAYVNPADSSAASTAKCVTTKAGTAVSNAAAMPLSVPVSVPTVTPSPVTVSTTTAPAVTQPAITQPAITQPTVTPATVVPPATTAPTPIPVPVTIPATVTYTCNNGYTLVANMCVGKTVRSRVAPFIAPRATYSCPSGYVLDASNNTCSKQISMDIATSSSTASVWDAIIDWFSGWFK